MKLTPILCRITQLSLLSATILHLACHPKTQKSDISHDAGRFVNSASPYQWREIAEPTFRAWAETDEGPVLAADHPMTVRLQFWADAMRDQMLRTSPTLVNAPRPLVRIVKTAEVDAHVNTIDVCVDYPITTDVTSKVAVQADRAYLQGSTALTAAPKRADCEKFVGTAEDNLAFVQWALRSVKDCKASLTGQQIVLTASCGANLPAFNFAGLQIAVTQNYLTVYSGLLANLPENEVISSLAHELGHYYMGHATADKELYNYFYARAAGNPDGKPLPLKSTDSLFKLAQDVQNAVFSGAADAVTAPLILDATKKGVSYYTMEQEADDIATEVINRMGIDPLSLVAMAIDMGGLRSAGAPAMAACKANFATEFATAVWIGDLSDPHHDFCYRAFNSFGELKAHAAYFKANRAKQMPKIQDVVSWDVALAALKAP